MKVKFKISISLLSFNSSGCNIVNGADGSGILEESERIVCNAIWLLWSDSFNNFDKNPKFRRNSCSRLL
jgi:hypothetical protein